MKKNIGGIDGLIRALLGIIIGSLYFIDVAKGNTGIILFLFGGALIFTSMEAFCPVYALFGINTRHAKKVRKINISGHNMAA